MDDDTKREIFYLYFNKMYNYEELIAHFKKRYTYSEIKTVISNHIKEKGKCQKQKT